MSISSPFSGHPANEYTHAERIEWIPKRPNSKSVALSLSGETVPLRNEFQRADLDRYGIKAYRPVSRSLIPSRELTRFVGILCKVS